MRALVVGGAGFIGSNLVDRLVKDNHKVIVVDDLSTGKYENLSNKGVSFYQKDITSADDWPILKDVDIVFHLAAKARVQPSIENPIEFNNVNVSGLLNILHSCVKYKVKRLLNIFFISLDIL